MALILADRVRETSTTTGTGALSLAGAVVGYQTFSSAIGNTNTCYYAISNPGVAEWEVGIGTYATSGNTLTRTTILKSSNSNAAVNFSAGTKDVFVTYPAGKSVYQDASGNVTLAGTLTANTIGAFTLGGTVAGGGNQLNNVIIGTTTPLAGAFTTLSASGLISANGGVQLGGQNLAWNEVSVRSWTMTTATTSGSLSINSGDSLGSLKVNVPLAVTGTLSSTLDATIYGLTVGRGGGAVSTNTAVGASALAANTSGTACTAVGYQAGYSNTTGESTAFGYKALFSNTTGNYNHAIGEGALFSNTTGSNNTSVGRSGLENNTTGGNNTSLGFQALISNTTASNNTAVGYQAGYANTTGSSLVAVGYVALASNTTGTLNTAVGWGAAQLNTTGANNSAFGDESLRFNTTGGLNTAIGAAALNANTTASYNTAVGYQAAYSNTTGLYETFVGALAGYANTTGEGNSALGVQALEANTTGGFNTAIGRFALKANTTASNNTAVGYQALYANTTGAQNTAVGGYAPTIAGAALQANTTGSYNVAMGTGALNANTTASGNTAVGYQALYTSNRTADANAYNLGIGYQAGVGLTTGQYNTFVGGNAPGWLVTSGSKNTILGNYNGNQGGIDIRTSSNYVVLSDGSGNIVFYTAGSSGTPYSWGLPGSASIYQGAGITFPATQSASTDANTLDDYEEGTFTPSLGGTATYSSQIGRYTKVGRMVTINFDIIVSILGTGSTTLISGIPFTASATGVGRGSSGYFQSLAVNVIALTCYVDDSASTIGFISMAAAGGTATINPAIFGNGARVQGSVCYFA